MDNKSLAYEQHIRDLQGELADARQAQRIAEGRLRNDAAVTAALIAQSREARKILRSGIYAADAGESVSDYLRAALEALVI